MVFFHSRLLTAMFHSKDFEGIQSWLCWKGHTCPRHHNTQILTWQPLLAALLHLQVHLLLSCLTVGTIHLNTSPSRAWRQAFSWDLHWEWSSVGGVCFPSVQEALGVIASTLLTEYGDRWLQSTWEVEAGGPDTQGHSQRVSQNTTQHNTTQNPERELAVWLPAKHRTLGSSHSSKNKVLILWLL